MNRPDHLSRVLPWFTALLLTALAAGCAGNRAPILGMGDNATLLTAPTVTAVAPVNNATGVPTNNTIITAAFSQPMAPITGGASFTLTAAAPNPAPVGTVALDPTSTIATFTLANGTSLEASTQYTATITGATSLATGLALVNPYVWHFTTGIATGATRPMVSLTIPATTLPGPTLGAPTNTAIAAVFTEDMSPSTINAASFTLTTPGPGGNPAGTVTYAVGSRTAVFTPTAVLAAGATYTATITTAATDLAGNALAGNQAALPSASDYVWTFTTSAATDIISPTITLTAPADLATGVALNSAVNATFSKAMDPLTITTATFRVQKDGTPPGTALAGSIVYDVATRVATFTPESNLTTATTYIATVTGARDLAGNPLIAGPVANPWTFTTGSGLAQGPVALGTAVNFGIMATAAISNTGVSTVNGNVSLDPGTTINGSPQVNGTVYVNAPASVQARTDLAAAFSAAGSLAPGTAVTSDLGLQFPLGIAPGTYTAAGALQILTPVTLDAGGNGNAVWVFQAGTTLTATASVSLANGAQAKNVFWVAAQGATLGSGTFFGTLMAGDGIAVGTGATITGRLLSGATSNLATVSLLNDTISVPAQ
jgi:hypothetical protein